MNIIRKVNIRMAVICSLLLAGCSSEEPIRVDGGGVPLNVQASITPHTRASLGAVAYEKSSFENDDQININVTSATGTNYKYKYISAEDKWSPVTATDTIKVTGNTQFDATYPVNFTSIEADQRQAGNYLKSNKLIATKTSDANLVSFAFTPAHAKITLVITYETDDHIGESAKLTGKNLTSSSSSNDITLLPLTESGKTHTYVGIVYPGTKTEYQIVVNETKGATTSKHIHKVVSQELKAGYNYTYNFSSNNNLILNQVTITAFNKQTETEVNDAT